MSTPVRPAASAAPQVAAASGWAVETLRDDGCLTTLGMEWDDLVARCSSATPFQTHAWLESWWRHYGVPGRLRLVLVWRGGRLVAAAPLMLQRRWSCAVLTPLGGELSDFTDVLVDDEVAGEASRFLAGALLARRGWQVIDFRETRPGAMVGGSFLDAWPGRHWRLPASRCLELPATPIEDLVGRLPTHARKTVRRRLNQLRRLDPDVRAVTAGEAERAVGDLVRLHERQWQGRGVNPEHRSVPFRRHLARAVTVMIDARQAELLEYRVSGRLVASSLVVIGPEFAGGYLYGADPRLRERVDVVTMLLADTLSLAHRLGCSTMSMLRGAEPHKLRWRPREVANQRLVLARPGSLRALAYASKVHACDSAARAARQRLPWLRDVRAGARRLATSVPPPARRR